MPGYELTLLLRTMSRPELTSTLRRTAMGVLDRGGFLRRIENLGEKATPYKISAHGQVHRNASYFMLQFEAPALQVDDMMEELRRDVDVVRSHLLKLQPTEKKACTLYEEILPPAYRREVQEMIEIGKRKIKPKFETNTGLPVTPFQR